MQLVDDIKRIFGSEDFNIEVEELCEANETSFFQNCGAGYNLIKVDPSGIVNECVLSKEKMGLLKVTGGVKRISNR